MLSLPTNQWTHLFLTAYCTISGNSFKWLFKLKNKLNINKLLKILLNCNNHPIFSFSRCNVQYNASVNLKTHIKHKNLNLYVLKLWLKKFGSQLKTRRIKWQRKKEEKPPFIFFSNLAQCTIFLHHIFVAISTPLTTPFPLGRRYEKSRFTRKHLYVLRIPLSRGESDICISNSNGSWNLLDDRLKYAQRHVRVVFEMARCRGIDRMEIRLLPLVHRVQLLHWFVRKCVNSPIAKIDR